MVGTAPTDVNSRPPIFTTPEIPTPPVTTSAPVELLVEFVLLVTLAVAISAVIVVRVLDATVPEFTLPVTVPETVVF